MNESQYPEGFSAWPLDQRNAYFAKAAAAVRQQRSESDFSERREQGGIPTFSDEALALRFAEIHAGDLRYVAAWGKWIQWTGSYWRFDDTKLAFDLSRKICREAAAECNKAKIASTLASAKTVAAVERLALADRRIAATVDQWDSDPWLLNTQDGVCPSWAPRVVTRA
jgi:phage/plasmid-associated DNA primase